MVKTHLHTNNLLVVVVVVICNSGSMFLFYVLVGLVCLSDIFVSSFFRYSLLCFAVESFAVIMVDDQDGDSPSVLVRLSLIHHYYHHKLFRFLAFFLLLLFLRPKKYEEKNLEKKQIPVAFFPFHIVYPHSTKL